MFPRASMLACLVVIFVYILAVLGLQERYSPNQMEAASIATGLHYRSGGDFSVGRVNPPLTHFVGTLAVNSDDLTALAANASLKVEVGTGILHFLRADFAIWRRLATATGKNVFHLVRRARLPVVFWGVLLLGVVAAWTWKIYGSTEAVLATLLVASDPLVLGLSAFVGTDIPCAATMLATAAIYSRWLQTGQMRDAVGVGLVAGVALSVKYTALCLAPALLLLWLVRRASSRSAGPKSLFRVTVHGCLALICCLCVLNTVYGWSGVGSAVDQLSPRSELLQVANRLPRSALCFPLPVAAEWFRGLDEQALDLGNRDGVHKTYFRGQSEPFGTPWYYVYGFLVKTPLPLLLLVALAIGSYHWRPVSSTELDFIVPGVLTGLLISCQDGFNWHYRYILPALIPLSIATMRSFAINPRLSRIVATIVGVNVVCSGMAFPNSLSYFNVFAGGSCGGHWHLNGSEADWGHGLLLLKEWSEQNKPQRPLYLSYAGPTDPVDAGFPEAVYVWNLGDAMPQSGYLAISISQLKHEEYAFVEQLPLVAVPGGTFKIYSLSP